MSQFFWDVQSLTKTQTNTDLVCLYGVALHQAQLLLKELILKNGSQKYTFI